MIINNAVHILDHLFVPEGLPIEESAWKLYQKWCKMPERIRNAWVAAGETVMNFSNFGFNKTIDNSLKVKKYYLTLS